MDEELVTVAQFNNLPEAHMARGLLETEGIETVLENEESRYVLGILDTGSSDVLNLRLKVLPADADRAREVLREIQLPPKPQAE